MRIIVAGASGAVGKQLVPKLMERGHQVGGMVRSATGAATAAALGAEPLVVDALDAAAVRAALRTFRPEAVIHQLTALPAAIDLRDFDRVFAPTNRLRIEGTDNLIAAARESGARRFVAQSYCGWPYARTGGPVKDEDDPLDPDPPPAMRRTLAAIRHLEGAVAAARDIGGVSLRYGGFYGPGTSLSRDGTAVAEIRRRRFPIVGKGGGVWSFIHIADAADAAVAAVESRVTGTFNVVDDEPAPVAEWLPALARAVGARPPLRVPAFIGRLVLPKHLYLMMTAQRGGANARFKREFGWRPQFASWRDGFLRGLG
jgi:nucleoside-diphosphate-sugar epimerase